MYSNLPGRTDKEESATYRNSNVISSKQDIRVPPTLFYLQVNCGKCGAETGKACVCLLLKMFQQTKLKNLAFYHFKAKFWTMYPNVQWCDGTGVTNRHRPEVSSQSDTTGLILIHFSVVLNNSSDWSNGVTIIESQKLYLSLIWIQVCSMMHATEDIPTSSHT